MTKQDRLKAANEFIKVIAGCGRHFFEYYFNSRTITNWPRFIYRLLHKEENLYSPKIL